MKKIVHPGRKIISAIVSLVTTIGLIGFNGQVKAAVVHDVFVSVHCEVQDAREIGWHLNYGLIPLIRLADQQGIKLTISLSPQWAEYFLQHPRLLYKLKTWLDEGHEIGILHYGLNHEGSWDFYTNETDFNEIIQAGWDPDDKLGSMQDLVDTVNRIFATPIVSAPDAKQLSLNISDYALDLTPDISVQYLLQGRRLSSDPMNQDVVRKPTYQIVNGVEYSVLSRGQFQVMAMDCDSSESSLNALVNLYRYLKNSSITKEDPEYKFGFGIHPADFVFDDPARNGCGHLRQWFEFLGWKISEGEFFSKTVSQILDEWNLTQAEE
jgi:hypothetical protein